MEQNNKKLNDFAKLWLAHDGLWFQAVEKKMGMNDAKRCNDTCWTRYSPYEAHRIKDLINLPENGGMQALKKALSFRMYAFINQHFLNSDRASLINA